LARMSGAGEQAPACRLSCRRVTDCKYLTGSRVACLSPGLVAESDCPWLSSYRSIVAITTELSHCVARKQEGSACLCVALPKYL